MLKHLTEKQFNRWTEFFLFSQSSSSSLIKSAYLTGYQQLLFKMNQFLNMVFRKQFTPFGSKKGKRVIIPVLLSDGLQEIKRYLEGGVALDLFNLVDLFSLNDFALFK